MNFFLLYIQQYKTGQMNTDRRAFDRLFTEPDSPA